MAEYQCDSCNYRFDNQKQPLRCPFCGKTGTVNPTPSAEQVMVEVNSDADEKRSYREELEKSRGQ